MLRLSLTVSAVIAVLLPLAASGNPVRPQLNGKVTARGISLTDRDGRRVKVLPPNSYRILVKDSSTVQNFHLAGPGVNLKTRVAATGTRDWTVELRPGKYTYWSDKNTKLRGSFTVTLGPPPA